MENNKLSASFTLARAGQKNGVNRAHNNRYFLASNVDPSRVAERMLGEYIEGFTQRNPNLHVFNAVMHLDEASPHLHIDFIPVYTRGRKNGLSTGVSMRAALVEQGCRPENKYKNERHYMVSYMGNRLPVRKKKKAMPHTWLNDEVLGDIDELRKRFRAGATVDDLRIETNSCEREVKALEKNLADLNEDRDYYAKLRKMAAICFEGKAATDDAKREAMQEMSSNNIEAETYHRLEILIADNDFETKRCEMSLAYSKEQLDDTSKFFHMAEKIIAGTFVDSLIELERNCRISDVIQGGWLSH
jgi:hypothetical protein